MVFQRYVPYLPAGGEIILFDRSWYNRAGVERFEEQVEQFFQDVTEFEKCWYDPDIGSQ